MKKTAIIDLGSNSIRMSIFEEKNGGCAETAAYRSVIKLSEGMNESGVLQPQARLRAVRALLEYKSIISAEGVECVRAVATAAVRKAKNRAEFLAEVREVTGMNIEVIDGEREAYYDFLAVRERLGGGSAVICDIGGGSTEIIAACGGDAPRFAVSIPYGSRSICEMFFSDGETPAAYAAARAFIAECIEKKCPTDDFRGLPLVGIGGCLRALSKYDLCDGTANKVERHGMSAERLAFMAREIERADMPAREAMPGIGKERADIIMGGVLLVMGICDKFAPKEIITMDVGVRDGVIADMMNGQK